MDHFFGTDTTQFNILKAYLVRETSDLNRSTTYGYLIKAKRTEADLPKSHRHDAFIIAGGKVQKRVSKWYLGLFARRQNRKLSKAVVLISEIQFPQPLASSVEIA